MDKRHPKDRHMGDIVEQSQFWDVEYFMRNFDRELAQLEHGLGHMIWDVEEHCVTTHLRPLPITPSFKISEDAEVFRLVARLPGISKEDVRLNVEKKRIDLFACSGDFACRPYYIGVDVSADLMPESAEAHLSGDTFEICVRKAVKKRLDVK